MRVTIKDIAERAGASHATVSLALRNCGRIGDKRRRQILSLAQEMGYAPNPLARGLRGQRTQAIGVLWSLCGPHDSEGMARRLTTLAQQRGYTTHLADSFNDPRIVADLLRNLIHWGVDGVVLQARQTMLDHGPIRSLLDRFDAVVLIAQQSVKADYDQVINDLAEPIDALVAHLAASGRRRPAVMLDVASNRLKHQRFLDACDRHGIGHDQVVTIDAVLGGAPVAAGGYRSILDAAWEKGVRFDALFGGSDVQAGAAMQWLARRGLRVPQDVAVIGFNDSVMAGLLAPPLASVAREDDPVAQAAGELLFSRLDQPDLPPRQRMAPMRFIWRESAGGEAPLSSSHSLLPSKGS